MTVPFLNPDADIGRHVINLYVWPGGGGGEAVLTEHGFTLRHWRGGGMSFWAVSDVNLGDLGQFEAEVRARTRD